jgi:hypothetical protein
MAAIDSVCRHHHEKIALANRGRPCMDPRLRGDDTSDANRGGLSPGSWTDKLNLDPRLRGDDTSDANRGGLSPGSWTDVSLPNTKLTKDLTQ